MKYLPQSIRIFLNNGIFSYLIMTQTLPSIINTITVNTHHVINTESGFLLCQSSDRVQIKLDIHATVDLLIQVFDGACYVIRER